MADTSSPGEGAFGEVLFYLGWWDCPRAGVTSVDGSLMHFDSPFDPDLDDYVTEFYLWPATNEEVADGLDVWRAFAAWRARFDAGERPIPFAGDSEAGRRVHQHAQEGPPETARRAVPEWRLDPDRSFAGRRPRHSVRWHFVGSGQE